MPLGFELNSSSASLIPFDSATTLAAHAELIVSRDKHLRNLEHFHRMPILNAADTLHYIEQQNRNASSATGDHDNARYCRRGGYSRAGGFRK